MFTSLDADGLVDCLSHVPPVELLAVRLLNERRLTAASGWFPAAPPECVGKTTQELIAYTRACAALLDKLTALSPVVLPTLEISEWPL